MLHSRFVPSLVAVVGLAGCAGAGSPFSQTAKPTMDQFAALTMPHYVARPSHPDRGTSWMAHGAAVQKKLFYVSDWATDDVFVYTFPGATLYGKLTGFQKPYGQCADKDGNIWIADFDASTIVKYAHGGSTPLATLDTGGSAIGCAVSATGDLAVANFAVSGGAGDIAIYANASGTPKFYSNPSCYNLWPPGYDKYGNLFVEGESDKTPAVCELPAHGTALETVSIDQTIHSPGSTMWDGAYIALTDQDYQGKKTTAIYRVKKSGSGLTVIGTTELKDSCDKNYADIPQPFIAGDRNTPVEKFEGTVVLGGNVLCSSRFAYWAYPVPSGKPIVVMKNAPAEPYGQGYSTLNKVKS
jgi:hypothetical protein